MKNIDGGEGEGKLNREGGGGGACRLSSSEKVGGGGLIRGGGLIEDLRYVTFLSQHTITISSLRTRLKQKKGGNTENEILRCRNVVVCYLAMLLISPCALITQSTN